MKIYHTETQEDYDALMVELEAKGVKIYDKEKLESSEIPNYFGVHKYRSCIMVDGTTALYNQKGYYEFLFPDVQIIKYKAKADEKMRFTKENVEKVIDEYFCQADFESCGDLIAEIRNLDDTPKKVVVPECFDEWYKEIEVEYSIPDSAKTFALWKLCQQGFGCSFEDIRGEKIPYETDLGEWLFKNKMLAINAVLNGYTIVPEKLYYIPLPELQTSDGIQQVLSKRKGDKHYFASRPNEKLKQRYTKAELAQVPEIYKFYAKPIEEEE